MPYDRSDSIKGALASMSATLDTTACKDGTQEALCDCTVPVRKLTSSGSKDEVRGGGGGEEAHKEPSGVVPSAKKPSTKAERRALQVKIVSWYEVKRYRDLNRKLNGKRRQRGRLLRARPGRQPERKSLPRTVRLVALGHQRA